MKLLIITQKVDINDDILGFFHRWIEEFAKHYESIIVICLQKGEFRLPKNVKVLSLGKETGVSRLRYFFNFYKYICRERKNYDGVFVHMNLVYVILGGLFWRLWDKKIGLWYAHGHIPVSLRIADKFTDIIFTSSKSGCRIESSKITIVGQGIDTDVFRPKNQRLEVKKFTIISVGRISPVKNYELLIKASKALVDQNFDFEIKIAGSPISDKDKIYFEELKNIVKDKHLNKQIEFVGSISNKDVASFYHKGDLFLNLSDTGSLDKAVLEAMSCGLFVLTSNEAFKNVLPEKYFIIDKEPQAIAQKIISLSSQKPGLSLREYVIKNHNLNNLIDKIVRSMSS